MKFVRVTEVLQRYYDWDGIPPGRLETALTRGIEVHRACFAVARGCWAVCKPDVEPFVLSFKRWVESVVEGILLIETRLVDKNMGFSGEPDLVLKIKGNPHPSVIDLKTPVTENKLWKIQLSAYHHLVQINHFPNLSNGGVLKLSPDGKLPKFQEYKNSLKDFNVFLSALNVHRFLESR